MPLSLNNISNNAVKATFHYGGEALEVEYRPNKITRKQIARMDAAAKSDDLFMQLDSLTLILTGPEDEPGTGLLKWWDMLELDGVTPIPIAFDRFTDLPPGFQYWLFSSIAEDVNRHPEALATQMAVTPLPPGNGKLPH